MGSSDRREEAAWGSARRAEDIPCQPHTTAQLGPNSKRGTFWKRPPALPTSSRGDNPASDAPTRGSRRVNSPPAAAWETRAGATSASAASAGATSASAARLEKGRPNDATWRNESRESPFDFLASQAFCALYSMRGRAIQTFFPTRALQRERGHAAPTTIRCPQQAALAAASLRCGAPVRRGASDAELQMKRKLQNRGPCWMCIAVAPSSPTHARTHQLLSSAVGACANECVLWPIKAPWPAF